MKMRVRNGGMQPSVRMCWCTNDLKRVHVLQDANIKKKGSFVQDTHTSPTPRRIFWIIWWGVRAEEFLPSIQTCPNYVWGRGRKWSSRIDCFREDVTDFASYVSAIQNVTPQHLGREWCTNDGNTFTNNVPKIPVFHSDAWECDRTGKHVHARMVSQYRSSSLPSSRTVPSKVVLPVLCACVCVCVCVYYTCEERAMCMFSTCEERTFDEERTHIGTLLVLASTLGSLPL